MQPARNWQEAVFISIFRIVVGKPNRTSGLIGHCKQDVPRILQPARCVIESRDVLAGRIDIKKRIIPAVHVLIQRVGRIYQPLCRQVDRIRGHEAAEVGGVVAGAEVIQAGFVVVFFAGEMRKHWLLGRLYGYLQIGDASKNKYMSPRFVFRSPFKPPLECSVDLLSHCSRAAASIQCVF